MRTHSDERVLTCESMEPADKSAYADWMAKAQAYWDQEDSDGEVEYVDFDGPTVHPATRSAHSLTQIPSPLRADPSPDPAINFLLLGLAGSHHGAVRWD
jgi:hypothetical protein